MTLMRVQALRAGFYLVAQDQSIGFLEKVQVAQMALLRLSPVQQHFLWSTKMPDKDEILNQISTMDSESIRLLVNDIWLLYDDAILKETGQLYNRGAGDPHWEGHL